jgi:hypothetical protein
VGALYTASADPRPAAFLAPYWTAVDRYPRRDVTLHARRFVDRPGLRQLCPGLDGPTLRAGSLDTPQALIVVIAHSQEGLSQGALTSEGS